MSPTLLLAVGLLACTDKSTLDTGPDTGAGGDGGAEAPALDFPEWAWQHWAWEDESTQDSVLAMLDGYAAAEVPVSAVIIDSPWETSYDDFIWDPARFPDPEGLVAELEARDVKLMLWIVPAINLDSPLYESWAKNGWFMQQDADSGPAVIDWWKGEGSLIDYWNPDALQAWHDMMQPVLDLGIHGWKCDGLDFSAIIADYSPGLGRQVERAEYSDAYYRDFYEHTRAVLGEDRVITSRPVDNYGADIGGDAVAFTPTDILVAGWVGDQDGTFDGIQAVLRNYYWSADYGYLAFGSDIGGYREADGEPLGRSREVYVRWAQLGAFSPVMESGTGQIGPWAFDEAAGTGTETVDIYRELVLLHHAMVPVLREQARSRRAEGRSLMTFLDGSQTLYMLGDDVLVRAIVEEGGEASLTLPEGDDWVWLFGDGRTEAGGTVVSRTFALDEYPAWVRAGSAMAQALGR